MKHLIGFTVTVMLFLSSAAFGANGDVLGDLADNAQNPGLTYSYNTSKPTWVHEIMMGVPIGTGDGAYTWEYVGQNNWWYKCTNNPARNPDTSCGEGRYSVHFPAPVKVDTIAAEIQGGSGGNAGFRPQNMDAFVEIAESGSWVQVGTDDWSEELPGSVRNNSGLVRNFSGPENRSSGQAPD